MNVVRTEIVSCASLEIEDEKSTGMVLPEDIMNKDTIAANGTVDLDRAVNLLEGILSSVKQGKLVVRDGGDAIEITPSDRVELGIQALRSNGIQEIHFDLKWKERQAEPKTESELGLSVEEPPTCGLSVEEACACAEDDFELAFLKDTGFFQPTTCST
jgi:amphi-Trp domain-containing protein